MVLEPVVAPCHICGTVTRLTFEHIPPKRAFNDTGVLLTELLPDKPLAIGGPPDDAWTYQKGMGSHTLCASCNNSTGQWYGGRFVEFCRKGMQVLSGAGYKPTLSYCLDIHPLSVLKQIVCMFLSINSVGFRDNYQEFPRFVLDRDRRHLPPRFRFFMYFKHVGMHRATPMTAKIDFNKRTWEHVKTTYMTEISFPPFGYLLTIDSEPPDQRVVEITHFCRYEYDLRTTLSLTYPVLPTRTFFPSDYRTVQQIARDNAEKGGIVP